MKPQLILPIIGVHLAASDWPSLQTDPPITLPMPFFICITILVGAHFFLFMKREKTHDKKKTHNNKKKLLSLFFSLSFSLSLCVFSFLSDVIA